MRGQRLPHHRHRSSFCSQSTSRGSKKLWRCSSHDPPWLWAYPTCPIPLAATKLWPAGLLLDRQEQNQGCRGRMSRREVALGSSRNPPVPVGRAPGRCWEVVLGFPAVGDVAQSRFGNWELSCLPAAPFSAQTATCFMAAEGHCTGSINPVSQRFLPGKLAPVQSRQEGLAALCRDSQQLSQLDGTLDSGILSAFWGQ